MVELIPVLAFFSFWTGACVASFLNVVIWRVPRGESIVSPPSHCPKCGASIRWWQNVPILSWLALRGRCAGCKAPISSRYVIVETIGGLLFLAAFLHCFASGRTFPFFEQGGAAPLLFLVLYWIWIALMIAGSFIDFDHKLLPDFTTVGGMIVGTVFWSVVSLSYRGFALDFSDIRMYFPVLWSVGGLVFGFGLLWLVRFFGSKAFGREAMGMGDVFLMGAVGALFGPVAVLVTLVLSSVIGSIAGLSLIALSRVRLGRFVEIPYGPYICLGCLVWMFFGPDLVSAYVSLLTR